MLHDYRLFFREYVRNFHDTGAIAPSSRWLAAALARFVGKQATPQRVLEVGPGTGAVTRQIVAALRPEDRFDLVELNRTFVDRLEKRFSQEAAFQAVADRSQVIHKSVEALSPEQPYDVVISGLPLNNFGVDDVQRILATYSKLLAPGGTLSFFQYVWVRPARAIVSSADEKKRLQGIGQALRELLQHNEFQRDCVLKNLPPAWVHHVRFPSAYPVPPPPAHSATHT